MEITEMEVKQAIHKIDTMELELLKLKARLLPKVKASKKEIAEIRKAKAEIARGASISGRDLAKKLG